jgi:hypothetical protein
MVSGRWPLYTPKRIKPEHYGIVSGIGISMYLEDSAWMLQLGKKVLGRSEVKKAGVVELLRSMWRHVKPGGILVMDAINPATGQNHVELQLNTIQTIGWRPMHQRSTDKMLDLAKQAGITAKHITRYVEPEDFFSVYVFEK